MKEVLIITNYFPPEMGAASNRIFQLAEGLQTHHFKVSVVTPLPNYPNGKIFDSYRGTFKHTSTEQQITIHRLWLFASNSKNKVLRLIAMLSYSFSLMWFLLWYKIPKTVIVQSPPLLVAFTSVFFLRSKKRKLILNVSDLWPLAGLELGALQKGLGYSLLKKMERFNYKHADLILGQSLEILNHILSIYPEKETFLYRNYPNSKPPKIIETQSTSKLLKLVYAGLLGVAQGIYKLCQELNYSTLSFHIYGSGAEKHTIEAFISKHPELDIVYHGEVSRPELHKALMTYDIAVIPLVDRIYGSVPSKIFEYARLGLPILYFGGGEGEHIVKDNKLGWVAKAGDYNNLNHVISTIDPSEPRNSTFKNQIQQTALESFDYHLQLNQFVKMI
ncbi:glycosyltransferase family 4 protein [Aestuariivivens insulae]|uniref:glycosyltransferase family 4 protein n=1 Tax=Aestuariivivens insulae TaxID=1621988 RepID=UPI001F596AC6|nr:glycosyltransferase family 4 protein [Aestuariivivens insulae]